MPRRVERGCKRVRAVRRVQLDRRDGPQLLRGPLRRLRLSSIRPAIRLVNDLHGVRPDARKLNLRGSLDELRRFVRETQHTPRMRYDSRYDACADHIDVLLRDGERKRETSRSPTCAEWNDDDPWLVDDTGLDLPDEFEARVHMSEYAEGRASSRGNPTRAASAIEPRPRERFDRSAKDRRAPGSPSDTFGHTLCGYVHLLLPPPDAHVCAEPLAVRRNGERMRRARRSDRDDPVVLLDSPEEELQRADFGSADWIRAEVVALDPERRREGQRDDRRRIVPERDPRNLGECRKPLDERKRRSGARQVVTPS